MTKEQLDALIAWVQAEIEYAIASNQEGSDGYMASAHRERDVAERLEKQLRDLFA